MFVLCCVSEVWRSVLCYPLIVLPVVPVSTPSGHPSPESVAETGSGTAPPLVCRTGNAI